MKYWERFIVYPLLGFMLIFILAILCKWYPRAITPQNLGFDYIGLIVGILSLLVAALLGWQIFNAIAFERKIDKRLDKYMAAYTKKLTQEIARAKIELLTDMRASDFDNYVTNIESIFNKSKKIPSLINELSPNVQKDEFQVEINRVKLFLENHSTTYAPMHIKALQKAYLRYTNIPSVYEFVEYLGNLYLEMLDQSKTNS